MFVTKYRLNIWIKWSFLANLREGLLWIKKQSDGENASPSFPNSTQWETTSLSWQFANKEMGSVERQDSQDPERTWH